MKHQASTHHYTATSEAVFSEDGEFLELEIDNTLVPPTDAKRSEARRLIEEKAEQRRLQKELDYLDGFSFDEDLQ